LEAYLYLRVMDLKRLELLDGKRVDVRELLLVLFSAYTIPPGLILRMMLFSSP
jgi:hypothetical protein